MKHFLIWAVGAFLTTSSLFGNKAQPNFLFIAVDDLNVYNTVLGDHPSSFLTKIYPDDSLRKDVVKRLTPNIQRLSDLGLTFNNAFCPYPLCGPSRTALLTGVPPHVSGYYEHDRHFRAYQTLTKTITLPEFLKKNGYYTAGIGKVFHKGRSYLDRGYFSDWPDQLYSWSDWVEANSGTGRTAGSSVPFEEKRSKYWDQQGRSPTNFTRFGVTNLPQEESNDYENARFIADLMVNRKATIVDIQREKRTLKLPENTPYFLACGLFAPHLPFVAQQEYFDLFPQDEMAIGDELLNWIQEDLKDLSQTAQNMTSNTHFSRLLKFGKTLDGTGGDINAWKAYFQAYLATIAYSDHNIGMLVDAIEENPQRENTIVFLWSDHGYHLGDKNRSGKTTLWEAANHSNLIIYHPALEGANRGLRTDATVSLQDIYPTIVALAGLERPAHIYGFNLKPILKDPDIDWPHAVLNTNGEGNHSLRTQNYRYIRFKNGDQELYALKKDPLEYDNLANLEKYQDMLEQFSRQLDQRLAMGPRDFK